MPIYEYRCGQCQRRVSVFQRHFASAASPTCPHCGSTQLSRLLSTFAVLRSEDDLFNDMAGDAALDEVDESDPRSVARWARRMRRGLGDEVGPEFDEMMDRMEAGEMPDEVDEGYGDEDDWEEDLV